ncbi:MAG: 23S rRNA (uracil(1939)-C(5))-methyltransferase RlmD [Ruminococcus sp.]|jgi:23S rRNA (uracil1939-C5)-methyltransferase|nr:23S rRNA (uracil(1939)-C(5))-methyltransferase RlmD [Ruminococcus sp.]
MKKNDNITLSITGLTSEGMGLGRYTENDSNIVIFVPFSAVGDVLDIHIVKLHKNYAYGKINRIITPSPDRIEADCPHFMKCGGCDYRHITYDAEIAAKKQIVIDAFSRIGGFDIGDIEIEPSLNENHYRNKAQLPVEITSDGAFYGFYAKNSHRIIRISDCKLQPTEFDLYCNFAVKLKLPGIRHFYLRKTRNGDVMFCFVADRFYTEYKNAAEIITQKFPAIKSVILNINPDNTNVILGKKNRTLCGADFLVDYICGKTVKISPNSFYQVNTPAAEKLYEKVAEYAEPDGKTVLDLYCGIGTIGLSLADRALKVVGAEIVPEAVKNCEENIRLNNLTNMSAHGGDAGEIAARFEREGLKPDIIITDPPRKGCDNKTLDSIVKMNPERIVMVSCNPATAARDCKFLCEHGYSLKKLSAHDMFPRTANVECIVLMQK